MNIESMDACGQNKARALLFITLLIFSAMAQKTYGADEQQWLQVPEANYAYVLELAAFSAKANYEEISSWQGKMDIFETNHYYGPNAAKMGDVDKDNFGRNSQHVFEEIKSASEFSVDIQNDKLCSKKEEPKVKLKAIDLDSNRLLSKGGEYVSLRAILTPDTYMWYMPDSNFSSKLWKVPPCRMAFIDKPEERKFNLSGDIRDPRIFFESAGEHKKLWDTLLKIRSNIDDRIKERIAGYPHIEISYLKTETGIKYRILTTWKGGKDASNYIRTLVEVDEAVGFNVLKAETINPSRVKLISSQYSYEKIGEIYIPKTVRKELCNSKGETTFTSEITITTIGINKPLPEDTFSIKNLGVEEGAIVSDNIKKAEFRFRKSNLVPIVDANNLPK